MAIAKRFRRDVKLARSLWGALSPLSLLTLLETLRKHRLSIASGDLLLIDGRWYVTHSGLLKIRDTEAMSWYSDPAGCRILRNLSFALRL
jgi:hypothetical protein